MTIKSTLLDSRLPHVYSRLEECKLSLAISYNLAVIFKCSFLFAALESSAVLSSDLFCFSKKVFSDVCFLLIFASVSLQAYRKLQLRQVWEEGMDRCGHFSKQNNL